VLKVDSSKIFLKLKRGNIKSRRALRRRSGTEGGSRPSGRPRCSGAVQPMIKQQGYEVAIGAKKDPTFGAVIIFGTGGELIEAMEDYAVALPPLNQALAKHMMMHTKIFRFLQGRPNYGRVIKNISRRSS